MSALTKINKLILKMHLKCFIIVVLMTFQKQGFCESDTIKPAKYKKASPVKIVKDYESTYNANWKELSISIGGTVIGGLILAIIIFLYDEKINPKINVSGRWKVNITISSSDHNPLINLSLEYELHLLQKGYEIIGSGEKIRETSNQKVLNYIGANRVRIDVVGYLERNVLKKSKLFLSTIEHGMQRESSLSYDLIFNSKNEITGIFFSTAGNSSGNASFSRI
ncbi:MAG: hypothetical protein ABI367_02770 [Mucilaginibacter sp.]